MPDIRYEDLHDAAAAVDSEQQLKGRLDSAVDGITSTDTEHKRVTGIMGKCANSGYLILRLAGLIKSTFDLTVLNALSGFAALDIEVPVGQTLAVYELSTTGTAICTVTLRYEVGT